MKRLAFKQLPLAVRIVIGIALLSAWISFEEFFVDRYGLWKYMPFYKVADACVWDLAVTLIIVVGIWWASIEHNSQSR